MVARELLEQGIMSSRFFLVTILIVLLTERVSAAEGWKLASKVPFLRGFPLRSKLDKVNIVSPAPVCDVLDCPPYELIHEESDFEIRRYAAARWVEAGPLQDVSFLKATMRGFHSLFEYIQGENEDGLHVPMTAPAITAIVPSAGPFCSSAFAVRLYLPTDFQKNPPSPKAELELTVKELPVRVIAVRKFGGIASDFNVAQEAAKLADSLERTPWANATAQERGADEEAYSIAQYNSPFELRKRVNEVWVIVPTDDDLN